MGAGGRGFFKPSGKIKGSAPRSSEKQNKQADYVAKQLKLNDKQRRELHDLVGNKGWGPEEMLEYAKNWFGID